MSYYVLKDIDTMNTLDTSTDTASETPEIYKFRSYDNQLTISVEEGQRVVKCLYKTNPKTGKAAGINSYILIPESHLGEDVMVENAAKLAPYVSAFFQSVEDKIIKENHQKGGKGFSDAYLSLDKILNHLDEAGQGNRLNKEKIETWFSSEMQEPLIAAFAKGLGMSEVPTDTELEKLIDITSVYKAKFASLASGKTCYRKDEAELMQKALKVTSCNDTVLGSKFYARLESMKNTTSNDLLVSL